MSSALCYDERGCPLPLIAIGQGPKDSLLLNVSSLDKVIENIDGCPVTVIAIVGPSRLGKSFILSYVVRYLEAISNEEMDLMGWQEKAKPINGFLSPKLVGTNNDGIWIWSRPYFVTSEEGEKTAVILLDCQGFSQEHPQLAIRLMSTSVLASSHIILNFTEDIPDYFLFYLNTCTKYGKTLKEKIGDAEFNPFQRFTLLIRDWQHDKYPHGENGGKLFLKGKIKENTKFWESVQANFETVNCFLLPSPGDKCASSDFRGSISEISTAFAKQLETFINKIVGENTVGPKRILQEPITAAHLKLGIINYANCFSSPSLPSAESLIHATEEIVNNIAIQKAIQAYRKSFFQRRPRRVPYYSNDALEKAHEAARKQAFSVLRDGSHIQGVSELKSSFQEKMQETYEELKQDNEKVRKAHIADQTESTAAEFRKNMEERFAVFEDEYELYNNNEISKESKKIKVELIDEFADKFPHESEEACRALIQSVEEIMNVMVIRFEEKNGDNYNVAHETMEEIVKNLHSSFAYKATEFFRSNPYETDNDELDQACVAFKESQEKTFQAKPKPGTRSFYGSYQEKLVQMMDKTYTDLKQRHEQRIRNEEEMINSFIEGKCSELGEKIHGIVAEGGMNTSAIRVVYEMMSAEIRREFLSINTFPPHTLQFTENERKLQSRFKGTLDNILKLDDSKKREVEKTYQESVEKVVSFCDNAFASLRNRIGIAFLTEEELGRQCKKIQENTLREYACMPKQQQSSENDGKARAQIEKHVQTHVNEIRHQNEMEKKLAEKMFQNLLQNLIADYENRTKHSMGKCSTLAQLTDKHNQIMDDLCKRIDDLDSKCQPAFIAGYVQDLKKNAETLFLSIKEDFKESMRLHSIEMKGILVDGRQFYHTEMGKHFKNNQFIQKDELLTYHQKAKQEAMKKCETKPKTLTELQIEGLAREIDSLFEQYKDLNFMNVDTKGNAPAIGIDLGTTYCCVGVYTNGKVHIIPNNEQGNEKTTPSYIFIDSDGNETIGKPAKDNAHQSPENTIFDAKRMIGRKMNDPVLQSDMKFWPFTVKEDEGVPKILVNNTLYYPEQISSKLLKYFRAMAEKFLKLPAGTIKKAVITVPAYFTDGQRQATIDAGELAELEVLSILNEPTAAAISYSMERLDSNAKNILVYDLGGGTFDVAVLETTKDGLHVLGVNGDTHLGGEDFDKNMMTFCVERFEEEQGINLFDGKDSDVKTVRDDCRRRLRRLQTTCENAKKDLTTARRVKVQIDSIINSIDLSVVVTQTKFNELNMNMFQKSINLIRDTLEDVKMSKRDIEDVVLVGGSSRIPMVQKMLEEFFEGKALNVSIDPDHAVGYGAAVHAAKLNGKKAIGDFNLPNFTDVTPMPIGIEIYTGELSVILEKNAKIPTVRTQDYYTFHDNQRSVTINVYQGENLKMAKVNQLLGSFTLTGIPPARAGKEPIDISMEINSMGVLRVDAVIRSTKGRNSITVVEDKQRMSADTKRRILAEGKARKH